MQKVVELKAYQFNIRKVTQLTLFDLICIVSGLLVYEMAKEILLTLLLFVISIIHHSDEKPAMWAVLLWGTLLDIYYYG